MKTGVIVAIVIVAVVVVLGIFILGTAGIWSVVSPKIGDSSGFGSDRPTFLCGQDCSYSLVSNKGVDWDLSVIAYNPPADDIASYLSYVAGEGEVEQSAPYEADVEGSFDASGCYAMKATYSKDSGSGSVLVTCTQ